MHVRSATPADAPRIAEIYNQGVAVRSATFQTRPQRAEAFLERIAAGSTLVAETQDGIIGVAWTSPYDANDYYAGVREATVYVDRAARGQGAGRALLNDLGARFRAAGGYKLVAKVFTTNHESIRLFGACGYREVGVHRRHGMLDGEWKDVAVLELLL